MASVEPDDQAAAGRIDLMQFWDRPVPPDDVDALMETWRSDPQFVHHQFTWESAHDYVADHFDTRMTAVLEACAVPAMQADVFRLCWLLVNGGVYIDADQGNRGRNDRFVDTAWRGHLFFRDPNAPTIVNGVLSFFAPGDPLVAHWLEQTATNIEQRKPGGVWAVTGPGVISKIYTDLGRDHPLFENVQFHGVLALRESIWFPDPEYKNGPRHWTKVEGSIYR